MSYVAINPTFYQMLQPESPWHPGAPGWSTAPFPGWGENPALVGPSRLAVEGLGAELSLDTGCASDRSQGLLMGIGIGGALVGLFVLLRKKSRA
jgi:hypothetical protein